MSAQVETMAFAGETPWHGIGNRVDDKVTTDEMLKAAGLDWRVNLWPMQAVNGETGETVPVRGRYALIRDLDNRVLTVTGNSWHPLQNADMLNLMRDYVEAGAATLETAGSLRGGKIIWGLAKLNHDYEVTPGDKVEGYLLLVSPHEVGRSISAYTTNVRVVCRNTLAMAEAKGGVMYHQNHLSTFNVEAAKAAIAESHEQLGIAERRAKVIASLKLSVEDAVSKVFVPLVHPGDEAAVDPQKYLTPGNQDVKMAGIMLSYYKAPGAIPGNAWGALNAITHWADHTAGRDPNARLYRAWIGDTAKLKRDAEEALYQLAA